MMNKSKEQILSTLPPKLVEKLMPFQKDGVQFAVNKNGRCLIADEMGLGKTLQAISVAYYYKKEWPLLIIVPSSLRYSWIEEFEKWLPDIQPGEINLIQSGSDVSGIGTSLVTIASFGLLSKASSTVLREALTSQGFQVVIVDESHYIRNVKTVSAKTVVPLVKNANRRILLSGTPALARPVELYPQLDALCPNAFGSWWTYTARYCDAKIEWFGKGKRRNVNGASNLEELQHKLASLVMIRREKKDVLKQLPAKQRQRVLFELKDSELKKEIRTKFEELRPLLRRHAPQEDLGALTGGGIQDAGDVSMLSQIQKLYQLSGEAKIGPAKEYIEMLCDNPNLKFLVFAYHHSMMNGITQSLYDKSVKFVRIDGETPHAVRPQLVNQFQSDPDTRVAVLSILAAGVGLTFTAASVVVFVEMYWTPGVMVQCEDRAHRIGQTNCVAVHYLVAKDTMDEWVWSAVCKKTIVTSTALTGKKQALKADAGDRYQIDVLSNADVWVPEDNTNLDLLDYFNTQQGSDQKSILDYFSSSQKSSPKSSQFTSQQSTSESEKQLPSKNASPKLKLKRKCFERSMLSELFENDNTPEPENKSNRNPDEKSPFKIKALDDDDERNSMIIIDSGSDDDFAQKRTSAVLARSTSKASKKSTKSSNKRKRKDNRRGIPKSNSKCELMTLFAKAKANKVDESIELSDDECMADNNLIGQSPGETAGENYVSDRDVPRNNISDSCEGRSDDSFVFTKKRKKLNTKIQNVSISAEMHPTFNEWNCPACTFLNHKDLSICEICDTPKKGKSSSVCPRSSHSKENITGEAGDVIKEVTKSENGNKNVTHNQLKNLAETSLANVGMETVSVTKDKDEINYDSEELCDADDERITSDTDTEINANSADFEAESPLSEGMFDIDGTSHECCEGSETVISNVNDSDEVHCNLTSSYFNKERTKSLSNNMKEKGVPRREVVIENNLTARKHDDTTICDNKFSPKSLQKKYHFKSAKRSPSLVGAPSTTGMVSKHCAILDTRGVSNTKDALCKTSSGSESEQDGSEGYICDSDSVVDEGSEVMDADKAAHDSKTSVGSLESCARDTSQAEVEGQEEMSNDRYPNQGRSTEDVDFSKMKQSGSGNRALCAESPHGVPVHDVFHYRCSKYTGRIYLLTQEDVSLKVNFLPMDVEVGNYDDVPNILRHPHNLKLVQRFVREWQSLTETKRRLIVRTGRVFVSPLREYEDLRSCKTVNTQRHRTKQDTMLIAMKKAAEVNGSVRVISKRPWEIRSGEDNGKGVTQVVAEDGTPLCLHCYKPYENHLLQKSSIQNEKNAWNTRFCSQKCSQQYWMVTNNDYCRDMVYEAERGICQMCQFDAHSLYKQVKDIKDMKRRAEIIAKSKLNSLNAKTKELMVKRPVAGQFWHVDHIVPVWEGGGQCDIDNLRTLCIVCHQKVTAKQAGKRATIRKLGAAVHSGDITAFFYKIS